jgi:REP element-mobilizing transposase RayT
LFTLAVALLKALGEENQALGGRRNGVFRRLFNVAGALREAVQGAIEAICGHAGCEVLKLNVQRDHVHVVVMIPPKVAVCELMGLNSQSGGLVIWGSSLSSFREPYSYNICDWGSGIGDQ